MARLTHSHLLLSLSVTATTALAGASPAAAQRTEATSHRARAEADDSTERQLRRLSARADSLARLYNESGEVTVRRRLGAELDRTVGQIAALSQRLALMSARTGIELRMRMPSMAPAMMHAQAMPRGWMGVVVSGAAREPRLEDGELIVRYLTYPEIVSVEPSSPAEKAGLTPSDTLLAYDGRDVRDRDISLTRLLRPNATVLVRVRRDGRTREVPVTIADVPSRIKIRQELTYAETPAPKIDIVEAPGFPPMPALPPVPPSVPMRAQASLPATAPRAAMPPAIINFISTGVAGAQLATLTEGLGRTVGVKQGVLVVTAPVGSPAFQSGLRDGDVIVSVSGTPVWTVAQVRERVARAADNGDRAVEMECVRESRTRKVALRW